MQNNSARTEQLPENGCQDRTAWTGKTELLCSDTHTALIFSLSLSILLSLYLSLSSSLSLLPSPFPSPVPVPLPVLPFPFPLPSPSPSLGSQDCQDRTARTGLLGNELPEHDCQEQGCQHRTAMIRQKRQYRKTRTARTGNTECHG
jgi:hypothetical protein